MEIGKPRNPSRVGDLLTRVGLIKQSQLEEALILSRRTATPVGRILLMTGSLKEKDLQVVLQAQHMIRTGQLPFEVAIRALYIVKASRASFDEALRMSGWTTEQEAQLGELAELLLSAEVVSESQLKSATARAEQMALPIGRTLVLMGLVSPSVMAATLNAQVLLKQNEITAQEAVHGIRIASARRISLEKALILEGIYQPQSNSWIKLGELFAIAGLLSESDGLWAVEAGLIEGRPIGEILVESGLVSSESRDGALELQKMVAEGKVNAQQAAELLKEVNSQGVAPAQALKSMTHLGTQVANLLKMSGLITDEHISKAEEMSTPPIIDLSACLLDASIINRETIEAARQCLELIRDERLKVEQAIVVLSYCVRSRITVKQTLEELAWDHVVQNSYASEDDLTRAE
ncbi:MAG: hypothetical protein C5B53_04535 [Candidatus Melainabacteria bacterium]|nr:MAG: hypothetical protein C5B53_04535 [Candidatus Melainabacteria bacterium]